MTEKEIKEVRSLTYLIDNLTGEKLQFQAYDEKVVHGGVRCIDEKGRTYWVRPEDLSRIQED